MLGIVISHSRFTSRSLAKKIAEFASEKKAGDITILDMRKVVNFCDYFVICSGNTDRQVRAIADGIQDGLETFKIDVRFKEGIKQGMWIVLDLGDVVVHIFEREMRQFYGLEHLWQDAKQITI